MRSFLHVPTRFTAVAETDLKDPLKALGITDMFDQSKANFAKITSKLFFFFLNPWWSLFIVSGTE